MLYFYTVVEVENTLKIHTYTTVFPYSQSADILYYM